MKQLIILIILCFLQASCNSSNSNQTVYKEDKITSTNNDIKDSIWVFNPKLIGNKIESSLQKSALIDLLIDALEREVEQMYNFDIVNTGNRDLLEFYDYSTFHFGDTDFNAYYAKIDYEDGKYELVLITNINKKEDYKSLILYEKLDSEVRYARISKINSPIIEVSYIYQDRKAKSQSFIVEDGLFLDYIRNDTFINEYWNAEWGANTYKQIANESKYTDYQYVGKITNHLKNGLWKEKRYSIKYESPVIITSNYYNGIQQGAFSVSIPFPDSKDTLIYFGNYKNGIKIGEWKMALENSLITKNKLNPTSYNEIFYLTADTKKIDKKSNLSIPGKWDGNYVLESAKIDSRTNKIIRFVFHINIVDNHIYAYFDTEKLLDFWCQQEYLLTDRSQNFIYCKGICDENLLHDFQLRTENGLFYIKSDYFGSKDWISIKKEVD